jgi:integrase
MCEIIEARLPRLWMPSFPSDLSRATKDGPLLPGVGSADTLNKMMLRWCREAGVTPVTPHMLRHSTATNLLRAGVPLHLTASLMNHSSVQVTMRYVASGGNQLREWLDKNL